jgi:hypothetical protein
MTAMGYHDVTTQVQRGFVESVSLKRTKTVEVADQVFVYSRISGKLYGGFCRDPKGFFIASAEKAFLDAVYLMSLGRYSFDMTSVEKDKLDAKVIKKLSADMPVKARRVLKEYGYIGKT